MPRDCAEIVLQATGCSSGAFNQTRFKDPFFVFTKINFLLLVRKKLGFFFWDEKLYKKLPPSRYVTMNPYGLGNMAEAPLSLFSSPPSLFLPFSVGLVTP